MELSQKINIIYDTIRLGMPLYDACILATCTDEEVEQIQADEEIQRKVKFIQKEEEMALLRDHQTARQIASGKGSTKGLEWMLEKLNPDRYGRSGTVDLPTGSKVAVYLPEKEEEKK